ncbi:MAG: pyridoxal phosphate-dependent aminotransferase [Thaumarchaeota archaeon]|nr:pyridoxal phosphate-dependent aminotransferase [Nitrososphaerota archaeon]
MFLSKIEGSPSLEVVNLVLEKLSKGEKVLSLAIGDPSSDTPRDIVDAAYSSMISGQVHYVPSSGIREVREAIRAKVLRTNGIKASLDETIFLTTKLSVYAALVALAESEFEALVPDPGYFYSEPVVLAGGQPVRYKLHPDFSLDLDEIKRKTTANTKAILVNSPSNPTGKVSGKSELKELYEFCQEKQIYIVSDEAYEDLTYEGTKHFAVGSLESSPELVISLFSLSKSYSMTGWRAGYLIAPRQIGHSINKFLENTLTCLPPFIQKASEYALNSGDRYIQFFRKEYSEKRKLVQDSLADTPGLELNNVEGAFYGFPKLKRWSASSVEFAKILLHSENVAILPGSAFGPSGEGRIRISFSGKTQDLTEGLERIKKFSASFS